MKKLNITKEAFEKSNYFKNKYGKLEYVSESGKVFKTEKGKILKFKESMSNEKPKFKIGQMVDLSPLIYHSFEEEGIDENDIPKTGWKIDNVQHRGFSGFVYNIIYTDPETGEKTGMRVYEHEIKASTKKFGKKFKESFDPYDDFEALGDELEAKYKRCKYAEAELYVDDEGSYTIAVRIDTDHKAESKEMNRFLTQ